VATVCRIDEIICLFCRISSLLWGSFAKETCNFIDPTKSSHPITTIMRQLTTYHKIDLITGLFCKRAPPLVVGRWGSFAKETCNSKCSHPITTIMSRLTTYHKIAHHLWIHSWLAFHWCIELLYVVVFSLWCTLMCVAILLPFCLCVVRMNHTYCWCMCVVERSGVYFSGKVFSPVIIFFLKIRCSIWQYGF